MHRIDTANSLPDANGLGKRGFRDGNKATGVLPTEFDANWCNSVQEELANVIESAEIPLEKADKSQLLQAIRAMIAAIDTSGLPVGTLIAITSAYDPVLHADYLVVPTAPTTLSRAAYPELFAVWNTMHGAGDGSTTFGMYYIPANYALVQASDGNITLTVGEVIAHTHAGVPNNGSRTTGAGGSSEYYISGSKDTASTGGPANLAAGSRVIFLVKYR